MSMKEGTQPKKRKLSSTTLRRLLNLYVPFIGAGIRVVYIAEDFRKLTMRMKLRFYNRNYFGTHFGGSLFSLTDSGYVLMLANILGGGYVVWAKSATIRFVTPGRGTVSAYFELNEEQISDVLARTASGEKYEPVYRIDIVDDASNIVASVEHTLYVRKARRPAAN